ncbi:acyltransferase [Euzebya sp.]|uniref:acyltransferase n=1 Tax=Euzebya sp. TaxID=1971409 RepID=UPI0035198C3F
MSAELSPSEAEQLGRDIAHARADAAVRAATAREATARATLMGIDAGVRVPGVPPLPSRTRWGWRRSVRFAVERRMDTPEYLALYSRHLAQRLRHPHVVMGGMVFMGRRVELRARRGHGNLELGAWCWIGDDNKLRAHEGNLRLGPKVVMGRDNVINTYLDIEIGTNALLGDWIYICDFDHLYDRLDVPIKAQGLVKTPVRVGADVWVGEKASILRGADVGSGSVVASQALVKDRIPPFSIVVGTPARVIRSRLPDGMTVEEGLALQRAGHPLPGDPLEG